MKFKHNNISVEEYRKMFPDAPIMSKKDYEKSSRFGDDNHMRKDKYRKMFSDMFKGDNNPNLQ